MAFKLDGNPLAYDVAFSHNDINYPANWLRLASLEEKEAIGIMTLDFIILMAVQKQLMILMQKMKMVIY